MDDNQNKQSMPQKQEYLSLIESENEKHIFFSGPINRLSIFNLCNQLTACELSYKEKVNEHKMGFNPEENKKEENDKIILHLTCPGGQVAYAFIAADLIETMSIPVYCIAEGTLASAGLIIFLAGKKRKVLNHTTLYFHETIHSVESIKYSDFNTFKKEADKINESLKQFYKEKTGLDIKIIEDLMQTEASIDSVKAKELNLATLTCTEQF